MTTVIVGKERESPPAVVSASAFGHSSIPHSFFYWHASLFDLTHRLFLSLFLCTVHTCLCVPHTHTSSFSLFHSLTLGSKTGRICENGRSKGGVEVIFRCHHATELRNETRLHILVSTVVDDRDIQ